MRSFRSAFVLTAVVALSACAADSASTPLDGGSAVRVINVSNGPINVLIDGAMAFQGLTVASVSATLPTSVGAHVVSLQSSTGGTASVNVQTASGATQTAFAYSASASSLAATVLADTGSVVPAGKSKLRVSHLSANAGNITIWRTQPDYHTPIQIMTPFAYQATSPYLQSDPGDWEVFVTAAGGTTKLATTGAITIPDGQHRTVVLLDSAGVMRFKVIAE